jgi:hypothetical protein
LRSLIKESWQRLVGRSRSLELRPFFLRYSPNLVEGKTEPSVL